MAGIQRVSYRRGLVARLGEAARFPAITIEAAALPKDVLALLGEGRRRHLSECRPPARPIGGSPANL
jgi:hypothetical protein